MMKMLSPREGGTGLPRCGISRLRSGFPSGKRIGSAPANWPYFVSANWQTKSNWPGAEPAGPLGPE